MGPGDADGRRSGGEPRCGAAHTAAAAPDEACEHEAMSKRLGGEAAARAASAAERAHDITGRLRALRAGEPTTTDDVRQAELAAELERERSAGAYRRAAEAHLESARSHRQAAELLDAAGHPEQAAEHRRKAVLDEEAARLDEDAAQLNLRQS